MNAPEQFDEGREVQSMSVEQGTVALLNKSEIDMQIATAHKYPRSIKRFRDDTLQMVTLNERVAEGCIYALPRGNKTIEGPSARFAEVVASAWGNCRAGARVVSDQGDFITAQGVFHDLERNVAITYEVQRRITDSRGRRYNADMIGVTGNAASSIALRNAILKGVPKAFWDDMYQAARQTVMGDFKTLGNRRADALKAFLGYGISQEQVFAKLEVAGVEDIGLEHLVVLRGLLTAIKEGDTTPEQAFAPAEGAAAATGPKSKSKPAETQSEAPPPATESKAAEPENRQHAAEAKPQENGNGTKPASDAQLRFMKSKAAGAAITEADICKRFTLETLDGISQKQLADIMAFIVNPVGA